MTSEDPTELKSTKWEEAQKKTFLRWANAHLIKQKIVLNDLKNDLKTGIKILYLVCGLSGRPLPRHSANPKTMYNCLENLSLSFDLLKKEKVKLVNIDSSDIYKGNVKLILGMFWTLITHFQLSLALKDFESTTKSANPKDMLLALVESKLQLPLGTKVGNFGTAWNDGILLSGLVNSSAPGTITDWESLSKESKLENVENALNIAEEYLGVSKIILAEEFVDPHIDEKSVMTYVSSLLIAKPIKELPSVEEKRKEVTDLRLDFLESKLPAGIAEDKPFTFLVLSSGKSNDAVPPSIKFYDADSKEPINVEIDNVVNNVFEASVPPCKGGNYIMEIKSGEEEKRVHVKCVPKSKERISFYTRGSIQAETPGTILVDSRYSGLEVKDISVEPSENVSFTLSKLGDGKCMIKVVAEEPGTYVVSAFVDDDKKEASTFKITVEPKKVDEFLFLGDSPSEKTKTDIKSPAQLIFFDNVPYAEIVEVNNENINDCVMKKPHTMETSPMECSFQSSCSLNLPIEPESTGLYVIESSIKSPSGRVYSLAPQAFNVSGPIEVVSNQPQRLAISISDAKSSEIVVTDSSGSQIPLTKKMTVEKVKKKEFAIIEFLPPSSGNYQIMVSSKSETKAFNVVSVPPVKKIETHGLSVLSDNVAVNEPTFLYVDVSKAYPVLCENCFSTPCEIVARVKNDSDGTVTEYKAENCGYGNYKIPLCFSEEGSKSVEIFVDGHPVPNSSVAFMVTPQEESVKIYMFPADPLKIKTHKLNILDFYIPNLLLKDLKVDIDGPVKPEFAYKKFEPNFVSISIYSNEPGIYKVHFKDESGLSETHDLSVNLLQNPYPKTVFGVHHIQSNPSNIEAKPKIQGFNKKSFCHSVNLPKNAKVLATMVTPSGNEIVLNQVKVDKKRKIRLNITPTEAGIHYLNFDYENEKEKILCPYSFYVRPIPICSISAGNSVIISTKSKKPKDLALIHCETQSKVPILQSVVKNYKKQDVTELEFDLKDQGTYNIEGTYQSDKKTVEFKYSFLSADPSELKELIDKMNVVNHDHISTYGVPSHTPSYIYIDATEVEYKEDFCPRNFPVYFNKGKVVATLVHEANAAASKTIAATPCGNGYYRVELPPSEEGKHNLEISYSSYPSKNCSLNFEVKNPRDALFVKPINSKHQLSDEPFAFLASHGSIDNKELEFSVSGPSNALVKSAYVDDYSKVVYVYAKTPGNYVLEVKCENEQVISPLNIFVRQPIKNFSENDHILRERPKALSPFSLESQLKIIANTDVGTKSINVMEPDCLSFKFNDQSCDPENKNPEFTFCESDKKVSVGLKTPEPGLHLITASIDKNLSPLPVLPLALYVDETPKFILERESEVLIAKLDDPAKYCATLYPIGKEEGSEQIPIELTRVDDSEYGVVILKPKEVGKHILSLKNESNSEEIFVLECCESSAVKQVQKDELVISDFNEGKKMELSPDNEFPFLVDIKAYEDRINAAEPSNLYAICDRISGNEPVYKFNGESVGEGIYYININVPKNFEYDVGFYLEEDKLPVKGVGFKVDSDVKNTFSFKLKDNCKFYEFTPCQFVIDARFSIHKVKSVCFKDDTPITYIINKLYPKVYVCTFYCESHGEKVLMVSSSSGDVYEFPVTINQIDNTVPSHPLPIGLSPMIGKEFKLKEVVQKVMLFKDCLKHTDIEIKSKIWSSGRLYSPNSNEKNMIETGKSSKHHLNVKLTCQVAGLHTFVPKNKNSKKSYFNLFPITLLAIEPPTALCKAISTYDIACKKIRKVKIVCNNKVQFKCTPENTQDYFNKKRFQIQFAAEEPGTHLLKIYKTKKSFIEFPIIITPRSEIIDRLEEVKVYGLDCLRKYPAKVCDKYTIIVDARSLEYNENGQLSHLENEPGFKTTAGYIKPADESKIPLNFTEISDGIYATCINFEKPKSYDLCLSYAWSPLFAPINVNVDVTPPLTFEKVYSSTSQFVASKPAYFIFYSSYPGPFNCYFRDQIDEQNQVVVCELMNNYIFVGLLLNKLGDNYLCIEDNNGQKLMPEIHLEVVEDTHQPDENMTTFGTEPRVESFFNQIFIPQIFLSSDNPPIEYYIPKGGNINGYLNDKTSTNVKIENKNREHQGIKFHLYPKECGLNTICLNWEVYNMNIRFLPIMMNVKPRPVLLEKKSNKLTLLENKISSSNLEFTFKDSEEKPAYKLRKLTHIGKGKKKIYNLYYTPTVSGEQMLHVSKSKGTPAHYSFIVQKAEEPANPLSILNIHNLDCLLLAPKSYITVDCSDFNSEEMKFLTVKLSSLDDNEEIKEQLVISEPIIENCYAKFEVPESFEQGTYEATVVHQGCEVSSEPTQVRIACDIKKSASYKVEEQESYFEKYPVEFMVDAKDFPQKGIELDIKGSAKSPARIVSVAPDVYYCSFLPMDVGTYDASVMVDGQPLSDSNRTFTVENIPKNMSKRPFPIFSAPYVNNEFTTTIKPSILNPKNSKKHRKGYKVSKSDKIEAKLINVENKQEVDVSTNFVDPKHLSLSFTPSHPGLHQLVGKITKKDGKVINMFPVTYVVEDNVHKVGVQSKVGFGFATVPSDFSPSIQNEEERQLATLTPVKEKKYKDLDVKSYHYLPPCKGNSTIVCNSESPKTNFKLEDIKSDELKAVAGENFVTTFPLPAGIELDPSKISVELINPSRKSAKIKHSIDSGKNLLIVHCKPKKSGVYTIKTKYDGINLENSPAPLYCHIPETILAKTPSLLNITVPASTPEGLAVSIINPDRSETGPLKFTVLSEDKEKNELKLCIACDLPNSGIHQIKCEVDSNSLSVEPSNIFVEEVPDAKCSVNIPYIFTISNDRLVMPLDQDKIVAKSKVVDKYKGSEKTSTVIEVLPSEDKDQLKLQVTLTEPGMNIINPKNSSNIPLFKEPIQIFACQDPYKSVEEGAYDNNIESVVSDIFIPLNEIPEYSLFADCELENMSLKLNDKDKKEHVLPIVRNETGKVGFLLSDDIENGKCSLDLVKNKESVLPKPIKVELVSCDYNGSISCLPVSKKDNYTPILHYHGGQINFEVNQDHKDGLGVNFVAKEAGVVSADLLKDDKLVKSKNIIVTKPKNQKVEMLVLVNCPSLRFHLPDVTVMMKSPTGEKTERVYDQMNESMIIIDSTFDFPGTYEIELMGKDCLIESCPLYLEYKPNKFLKDSAIQTFEINKLASCWIPIMPRLSNMPVDELRVVTKTFFISHDGMKRIDANIEDIKEGGLKCSFVPKSCGTHFISFTDVYDCVPYASFVSSFVAYKPSPNQSYKVIAFGNGLKKAIVNKEASFTVDTTKAGEDKLEIYSDIKHLEFKTSKNSKNQTIVTYQPDVAGKIPIHITYGGISIPGSPYTVNVSDSKNFNVESSFNLVPLNSVYFFVKKNLKIKKDMVRSLVTDSLNSEVISAVELCPTPEGTKGSKLCLKFFPKMSGIHKVQFINGRNNKTIKDGKRSFYVGPWYHVPEAPFVLSGSGIEKAFVGENNCFILTMKARSNNNNILFNIDGPENTDYSIKLVEPGRFYCSWKPFVQGTYTLTLKYDDIVVDGTPVQVEANYRSQEISTSDADELISVQGDGLKKAIVNSQNLFSVVSSAVNTDEVDVTIEHDGKILPSERKHFSDSNSNSLSISYTPPSSGIYKIDIKHNEKPFSNSPFFVVAENKSSLPHLVKCYGIEKIKSLRNSYCEFQIDGSRANTGRPSVEIVSTNGATTIHPKITHVGESYCIVTFKIENSSDYNIWVSWDGENIPSSPFKVLA